MASKLYSRIIITIALAASALLAQACDSGGSKPASPTAAPTSSARSLPPAIAATAQSAGVKGNLGLVPKPENCLAKGDADLERQVFELVNAERAKQNPPLPALKEDSKLTEAARSHTTDQACTDNLSHDGSNGSSAGDRITAVGYNFSTWGENVAAGQTTAQEVMEAWMDSEGHRENILSPDFTQIGVGYMAVPDAMPYWTQVFATPGE